MRGALEMNITFTSRKTTLDDKFRERAQKKLDKFDRFFEDANGSVTVTQERNRYTVEVTIKASGMFYRAEKATTEMFDSLESVTDSLFRQIIKNKTRLEKRLRVGAFQEAPGMPADEVVDEEYRVVKSKRFSVKQMMVDEAILQMNMLDHEFFLFRNGENGNINLVYKRKDGNYGLIEPDELAY